jgi:class 3 adenylate cyclase
MEPQVQYTTTPDGASIAFYEMGEGPPLVMVSTVLWSHLRISVVPEYYRSGAGIGRGHRVIRYDSRGTGLSSRDTLDFSLEARLADLQCVIDHLGLQRFALFAAIHGCPAAIAYTASHPEQVTHLMLWRPYARGKDLSRLWDRFASLRGGGDWDLYTTTMANVNVEFKDSALAERVARRLRESMTFESLEAAFEHSKAIDVFDLLPQIQAPTLVAWSEGFGEQPRALTLEFAKTIAARIPGAHLLTSRGSSWSDKATQAIEEFLGDTGGDTLPSGTAIILFADVVDSTALTERLGDSAFREKARGLDEAMRAAIRENGGTPVEGKTLGDGVLAVFTSAKQAIACAQACHNAASAAGLSLHAGIHAGDVIREADADGRGNVYGGAVNIAARVAAASAAGETLVSATVRDLARTSAGVAFEDRGDQALKGVGEPVRVFAVSWRG